MKAKYFTTFITVTLCIAATSCHKEIASFYDSDTPHEVNQAEMAGAAKQQDYSDLRMFELKGPVKECIKETFYSVELLENDSYKVDSTASKRHTATLYFDKLGNYVPSASEKVDRDEKGRIVYWRDKRPNAKGVDPGMLRDTLRYTHVNGNVLQSKGMGEFAVTVYDADNRIVGQYSDPDVDGTQMAAFNIYREFDNRGNWTKRVTVWTTQSAGGRPHVSYTLDNRTITYY